MADLNFFNAFMEALVEGTHDLDTHTFKVYLTNAAPDAAADSLKTDLAEISAGNGYTAGGTALNVTSSGQTGGTYKLIADDVSFDASGGSIGPFRYAVLYNDTATGDPLIGWWDYGTAVTLNAGENFVLDFGTDGVLNLAPAA